MILISTSNGQAALDYTWELCDLSVDLLNSYLIPFLSKNFFHQTNRSDHLHPPLAKNPLLHQGPYMFYWLKVRGVGGPISLVNPFFPYNCIPGSLSGSQTKCLGAKPKPGVPILYGSSSRSVVVRLPSLICSNTDEKRGSNLLLVSH